MRKYLIIMTLLIASNNILFAQQTPFRTSIGYAKTEAEKQALDFVLKYEEVISGGFYPLKNGTISYTPDIDLKLGSGDAFNGIVAKYTGLMQFSKSTTLPDGTPVLQFDKFIHVLPFSLGIETDKTFNNINGIFEFGYVPYYRNLTQGENFKNKSVFIKTLLRDSRVGGFIQVGYKFSVIDSIQVMDSGGDVDESAENPDDAIFRLKMRVEYVPTLVLSDNGFGVGVKGSATTWFDMLNNETYYNILGAFSILINSKTSIDFSYEKGSGAPNFNEGEQYGVGLTTTF